MKENNIISLAKFISRYESFYGKDLKKLTHEDVKTLFPDLKRCSYEAIKDDPSLVYQGDITLVSDGHKIIPYFIPKKECILEEAMEFVYDAEEEIDYENISYDYVSMSPYELKKLLHTKFSTCKQRHLAKKELIKRGIVLKKKYRRCEEKRKKIEEE